MKLTERQKELLKQFRGYYGHVPEPVSRAALAKQIKQLKQSWRMFLDGEHITEGVHIEGLSILNEIENTLP